MITAIFLLSLLEFTFTIVEDEYPRHPFDPVLPRPCPTTPTCVGFTCPKGTHCELRQKKMFSICWPPCKFPNEPTCVPNNVPAD